jgi:hypothetical protein
VADNFDITLDPVKMIQMSVGALVFSRPDVKPARQIVTRSYTAQQVNESMRLPESARPYFTPGFPVSTALRHAVRIESLDGPPTESLPSDEPGPYFSDTGELAWYDSQEHDTQEHGSEKHSPQHTGGLVTIDTDRTQALVGFVKTSGRETRHLAAEVENEFCAITLSSLDSKPIARSETLLLTACSRIENTGTKWNRRRTLWEEWGHGPTRIEPVKGYLVLKDLEGPVEIRLVPLDGEYRPLGDPIRGRRLEIGWEIPLGDRPTTQYILHVIRSAEQFERVQALDR